MNDPIFTKIQSVRAKNEQLKLKARMDRAKEVKHHEYLHAKIAKSHVDAISFYYHRDANNIETIQHGSVTLNTSLGPNRLKNIQKLEQLIAAADAVDMSSQDKKMKKIFETQLRLLRQTK